MPYCRDCGTSINSNVSYCYSCENDIINRSRNRINRASDNERNRICNDRNYAHSWLQSAIGWIAALWDIMSKVFSGGGCYITTAVVSHKGLDDSSKEMTSLRLFRDKYLLDSEDHILKADLKEYYVLGQIIVNWANSREDADEIWDYIALYVDEVISLIDTSKYDEAYYFFKKKTLEIRKDILTSKHIFSTENL